MRRSRACLVTAALLLAGCSPSSGRDLNTPAPAVPRILQVVPDGGDVGGGNAVTILTENFEDDFTTILPVVRFDTAEAAAVVPVDAVSLEVITPPDPNPDPSGVRTVDVRVVSQGIPEQAVLRDGFTYISCLRITPDTGPLAGGNGVSIDLVGTCLGEPPLPIRTVEFDGIPSDYVVVISPTNIECTVPPGATSGPVDVAFNGRDAQGNPCRCVVPDGYTYQ